MKSRNIVALASTIIVAAMFAMSGSAYATPKACPPGHQKIGSCGDDGQDSGGVGVGVGIGVGVAESEANANASVKSTNTNKNYNTNQQQQGQVQGQQQGQTQTATGGNATAITGPSTSISGSYSEGSSASVGDVKNTATGGTVLGSGNSANTNITSGGNATIEDGAVSNTNKNTAFGGVGIGGQGGEGGSVTVEDGAVENNSNASASVGDSNVVVNNNFGGEDGNGSLANQTVEGSTQIVEGSDTSIQIDTRTDFRGAPVASVAPVFSTACSGGMSFQARDLGISVGDAEYYCKLLQLADARYAQAQTYDLTPPSPPTLSDCTGNVPDYTKGSRASTELQKETTASCFRQNEAAMEEYRKTVVAYNEAARERTEHLNEASRLVNEAQEYVESQRLTTNIAEQSRKVMYPLLLVKTLAILFF